MKTMGWDWETYLDQPDWLIEEIIGFMNLEAEAHEKEMKKVEMNRKGGKEVIV